jgi:hypothetical protein
MFKGAGIKMEIKKTDNPINTRKPLREGNIQELIEKIVPLCNYSNNSINFEKEGNIKFLSKNPIFNYNALFSFVLYYRNNLNSFINSRYYIGLLIYAEIIHNNYFFKDYGMVIYTDQSTSEILKNFFSIYEKCIIGIVDWPKFKIGDNIEGTVLRCLRFHALEAFPCCNIFVRDADTIFPTEIFSINHAYQMGVTGKSNRGVEDDYRLYMIEKIGAWEEAFIRKIQEDPSQIIIGVNLLYLGAYHTEFAINLISKYNSKFMCRNNWYDSFCELLKNSYFKSNLLSYKSPSGVLAGFVNFKKNRPSDLWLYSFDYINSQYELKRLREDEISNRYTFDTSVGKDERIILFRIIAKYWSLCFFFTIYYTDTIEYYSNKNISDKKIKSINEKCSNIINYHELLNLGKEIEYKKNKKNKEYSKGDIKVWTKILDPTYIDFSYNKKITKDLLGLPNLFSKHGKEKLCSKIGNSNIGKTFNEYYKEIFKDFSEKYLIWIETIGNKKGEDIIKELKQIINIIFEKNIHTEYKKESELFNNLNNGYNSDNSLTPIRKGPTKTNERNIKRAQNKDWKWKEYMVELTKLTINDIKFIYKTELPPIKFTKNPESII